MSVLHCCIWKSKEEAPNAMKQCRFQIILKSKYNKVVQSLAFSVEPTLFCPMCRSTTFFFLFSSSTAELWQPSFCPQSRHVILMSFLTAHMTETSSKHVRTYGKYSFLECNWQTLPVNKGTREQSEAFMKAFDKPDSILNHSSMGLQSIRSC